MAAPGLSVSRYFCELVLRKFTLIFPIKVYNCNDHSHFTCFAFSIPFRSPLMVSVAVLVTLIGRGSVDVKLRPTGLSNLRPLSTCNPVSLYPISYSPLELLLESSRLRFLLNRPTTKLRHRFFSFCPFQSGHFCHYFPHCVTQDFH